MRLTWVDNPGYCISGFPERDGRVVDNTSSSR